MKKTILLAFSFLLGCTSGNCRSHRTEKMDDKALTAATVQASSPAAKVKVFKYDGSLQCGMGKAISLDQMAKELSGIPIHSSIKKRDGLMHIQVCGSITGMANVFELPTVNLKQAEGKGFKKWSFE